MEIERNIKDIKRAGNNRATCNSCLERIGKGSPKVELYSRFRQNGYLRVSYVSVCYRCGVNLLDRNIKDLQKTTKKFKRMVLNNKKSIEKMKKLNNKLKMIEELK